MMPPSALKRSNTVRGQPGPFRQLLPSQPGCFTKTSQLVAEALIVCRHIASSPVRRPFEMRRDHNVRYLVYRYT
jgi:hypothetical protein